MSAKEKLYDAFGELIYAVAMADGEIQQEETAALSKILNNHPWASEIDWSFRYEAKKDHSVDEVYSKVITFCKIYGPTKEYAEMIDVMTKVAEANNGIGADEKHLIETFKADLVSHFQTELDKMG